MKNRKPLVILIGLIILLVLIVAAIIVVQAIENKNVQETDHISETETENTELYSENDETPVQTTTAADYYVIVEEDGTEKASVSRGISRFTTDELVLLKELVYAKADGKETQSILEEIAKINESDAAAWTEILEYWDEIKAKEINSAANGGTLISTIDGCPITAGVEGTLLPDGLPEDDTLCLVGLGFELNSDGTMKDEMLGRLETIRACALEYPNAYILLTGGPTALLNKDVSEASVMAQWLTEHGISEDRLIVENKSMTSATNAVYSYEILKNEYPDVTDIAIITSDYHVALGSLLFEAQFIMARSAGDETALNVISNAAFTSEGIYSFDWQSEAKWLWILIQQQVTTDHDILEEEVED